MREVEQDFVEGVSVRHRAGTPFSFTMIPLPNDQAADALETLEFAGVLAVVAGHAAGPLGAARIEGRRPTDDLAWIRDELALVGEVAALFRRGDSLLAEAIPEVGPALSRLRIEGSILDGTQLAALHRVLAAARRVEADLRRVAALAPKAAKLARPLPDKAIDRRLELSVGPAGEILDTASPRLAAARREVHAARQRLVRRLESVLRNLDPSAATADASVTVRGGRYVIPVRRDSRNRPSGIIHDESGSAGTLFVEPSEAVDLGNAFREAEVAEEREVLRVLQELAGLLRPDLPLLRDAAEMCVAVDDLVARARYAVANNGEIPEMLPAPAPLVIVNGRHPLLLTGTTPVIPFDLTMASAERTLLISGPNTGGKTVLLKAVGLATALAQSGIVPPVGAGSQLAVFHRFYTDIGDRQSIAASLSTFSAHVRTLRRVLDEADDATLVLLDEVGSGTDPAEGAALAAAALVSLTRRGAVTLATTHLGTLKDLATHTPGVVNASLQFDAATLTPTYRFQKGVPGRSYGLAIARRLGIDTGVLADAEARVPDAERSLDALLAAAEERDRELRAAQRALVEQTNEMELLRATLARQAVTQAEREATLARREREAEREGRRQVRELLLDARQQVEGAINAARAATDEQTARDARRLLEDRIRVERERLAAVDDERPAPGTAAESAVGVGARVRIPSGQTGDVLEIRPDGKLVVGVGRMRMVIPRRDAAPLSGGERRQERAVAAASSPTVSYGSDRAAVFEVDLRGMTGDEAEQATVAAIDAAVLAEQPFLRIIHGKGTGVVRERVRQVVGKDRRVARFELAPPNQGGTGVTIVEFSA